MGDRVAVMRNGFLQQLAPPRDLYRTPANVFVAGFIGSPPMTLCKARIERDDKGDLLVWFGSNSLVIDETCLEWFSRLPEYVGSEVVLGVRPERFFIPEGDVPDGKRFRTEVDLVEILGAECLLYLKVDAQPISSEVFADVFADDGGVPESPESGMTFVANLDARQAPQRGDVIDIAYETDALHFFDAQSGEALT